MTKRQQQLLQDIAEYRGALVENAPQRVGQSAIVRLPQRFVVNAGASWLPQPRPRSVIVMASRDGVYVRDYDPLYYSRKGRTEPKPRLLMAF